MWEVGRWEGSGAAYIRKRRGLVCMCGALALVLLAAAGYWWSYHTGHYRYYGTTGPRVEIGVVWGRCGLATTGAVKHE